MRAKVVVRQAVADDVGGIRSVAHSAWSTTYTDIILPENRERFLERYYSLEALGQAIGWDKSWFFVAVVGDEIVGFAQFILREDGGGDLSRIYVLSEWQRQGVGTLLLVEGVAVLRARNVGQLFVTVEKGNRIGRDFYEGQDFQALRESTIELPGQDLSLVEYVLSLNG